MRKYPEFGTFRGASVNGSEQADSPGSLTTPPESVDPRKNTNFQSRSLLISLSHLESFLPCLCLLFKEKPFLPDLLVAYKFYGPSEAETSFC